MPIWTQGIAIAGTATRTIPLVRAQRGGRLVGATFCQEADTDGTKTAKIRNLTRAVDMTAALDIAALAALAAADFVVNQDGSADFSKNDLLALVYTVTVAGAAGPTNAGVSLDVSYGQMNDSGIA